MRGAQGTRQSHRVSFSGWRHHRTLDALEPRRLMAAAPPAPAVPEGTWQVPGGRGADRIVIELSPEDASVLRASVGGKVVDTRAAASVNRIDVLAGAGDDEVTVSLGERAASVAVRVDGGRGRDRIAGGDGDRK